MTDMLDMARFTDLLEARGRTVERQRHIRQTLIFLVAMTLSGAFFTLYALGSVSPVTVISLGCWTIIAALSSISASKDLLLCETVIEAYDKVLIPEHKRN